MSAITFKACLFDLDGTLVNSIESVNRSWRAVAKRYNLNTDEVLSVIQGRPADESVRELLHGQPPSVIEKEIAWLKKQESEDTEGVVSIPGAMSFIEQLESLSIPWGIVTSCNTQVAKARMKAANIPSPEVMVTFEDVKNGKPAPEPYLLGSEKIGVEPEHCLVFEDAPAGVISAIQAGANVFGILSHFTLQQLELKNGATCYESLDLKPSESNLWQLCPRQQ